MPSERDQLVAEVFAAARGFALSLVNFENNGPLLSGAEILAKLDLSS